MPNVLITADCEFPKLIFPEQQVRRFVRTTNPSLLIRNQQMRIQTTHHAIDSWNSRVGPFLKHRAELSRILNLLTLSQGRITLYPKRGRFGVIDNDILFTYEDYGENVIRITTFYGRISLNPPISSFLERRVPRLHLDLDEATLRAQSLPIIPNRVVHCVNEDELLRFEHYCITDEKSLYCVRDVRNRISLYSNDSEVPEPIAGVLNYLFSYEPSQLLSV